MKAAVSQRSYNTAIGVLRKKILPDRISLVFQKHYSGKKIITYILLSVWGNRKFFALDTHDAVDSSTACGATITIYCCCCEQVYPREITATKNLGNIAKAEGAESGTTYAASY